MDFLALIKEYGVYLALPIVIAFIVQGIKKCFGKFIISTFGMRVIVLLPLVLGLVGGLFLPLDSYSDKVLIGGSLGCVSSFIYKVVTRTLISEAKLKVVKDSKDARNSIPTSTVNPDQV